MQQPHSSAQHTAVPLPCIYPLTAPNSSAKTSRREIKTLVLMSKSISIHANLHKSSLTVHQTLGRCNQFAWSTWDWINAKYDKNRKQKEHQVNLWMEGRNDFFYRTLRQCLYYIFQLLSLKEKQKTLDTVFGFSKKFILHFKISCLQ